VLTLGVVITEQVTSRAESGQLTTEHRNLSTTQSSPRSSKQLVSHYQDTLTKSSGTSPTNLLTNMKLKDRLDTYTTPELRRMGLKLIAITRQTLGHGNKPFPKLKIRNGLTGSYGQYDFEALVVNPSACETVDKFVKTIIHEYTHHIQKGIKRNYASSQSKHGYWNCPFEVEARGNETKYKSIVWKQFKQIP
jgi:hypothetical protein